MAAPTTSGGKMALFAKVVAFVAVCCAAASVVSGQMELSSPAASMLGSIVGVIATNVGLIIFAD